MINHCGDRYAVADIDTALWRLIGRCRDAAEMPRRRRHEDIYIAMENDVSPWRICHQGEQCDCGHAATDNDMSSLKTFPDETKLTLMSSRLMPSSRHRSREHRIRDSEIRRFGKIQRDS